MEQTARRQEQLPGAFNGATINSQHGRVRWYLVHTHNGKERETCEKVRRIIPHNLMQDAFVMQKEFWFKRDGAWSLQTGVRTISWTAPRRIQASCGTPSGSATRGTS